MNSAEIVYELNSEKTNAAMEMASGNVIDALQSSRITTGRPAFFF
jgi:hypothetical protein